MIIFYKLGEPRCLRLERGSALPTDGDAERFGIVDTDGAVMQPNSITAILFDSLMESRGWINALAGKSGVERHPTPLGFECVGELIHRGQDRDSGEARVADCRFAITSQEKTELLRDCFLAQAVARRGKPLGEPLKTISNQVGSFFPPGENFRLTPEAKTKFTEKLEHDPREFCGHEVSAVVRKDGLKLVFRDGSWVCYRLSGTEPVVRVCAEAAANADSRDCVLRRSVGFLGRKQTLGVAGGKATKNSAFLYFLASRFARMAQSEGLKFYRCHR
jgi:phosphoglucomutase